ncbi:MAG: hypothetical protein AAB116_15510 [Candidatus Poribacteria bacterium]
MSYFDFEKVAREANIPIDKLDKLSRYFRQEFPYDDMMYELHVLRSCMAIRDGYIKIEDAIDDNLNNIHLDSVA